MADAALAPTILIVDDEVDLLNGLQRVVTMEMECRVLLAENGNQALSLLHDHPVDLVLADIRMPGMDGLELLKAVGEMDPAITVLIMTAYGTIERAVAAIKHGAYDFIKKPLDMGRLMHLLRKGLERNRLVRENNRLMRSLTGGGVPRLVGQSPPMRKVQSLVKMLAQSDVTVMIQGETGTGKDLAAQAIHGLSGRVRRPMVTVNCPALPVNILESELFGYRKGAFTDAREDKTGLFQQAHGSTIFLDEIGDLNLEVQTKLLRILEDKKVQPLGAVESQIVDVRIIAATNQDLHKKLKQGEFRDDLYYRLRVATLTMPALRDIRSDIPLLAEHFLRSCAEEQQTAPKTVTADVMAYLMEHPWPGNVRELENKIRGWYAVTPGSVIAMDQVRGGAAACVSGAAPSDFKRPYKDLKAAAIEAFTCEYIHHLLAHTGGNITLAARISGIKRQSLQKIISRHGIRVKSYRDSGAVAQTPAAGDSS
jgi:DNA-binding NtrC family response regulator